MKKILRTALFASIVAAGVALAGCRAGTENRGGASEAETGGPQADRHGTEPGSPPGGGAVEAVYPEMAPYPNEEEYVDKKTGEFDSNGFSEVYDAWWEEKREKRNLPEECAVGLKPFFASSIRRFLTQEEPGQEGQNRICSPLNLYMALTMVAEITDGNSRQQILDLLGSDSVESLRAQAEQVWNANYCRDGAVTSLLANSLWLDEDIRFKEEVLKSLADHYHASSFWGKMGSEELDERMQAWLNEQTEDLLKEQASGVHMTQDTLMALASTIYFRAKWSDEFSESQTREETFHGPQGDTACDFMHQGGSGTYYWGDKFGAVNKHLQESGGMWLILPDEGVTPEEVLREDEVMRLFLSGDEWADQKSLIINLAMPKFDVASDMDLKDGLWDLGITDVFDEEKSDFTPLVDDMGGLFISKASHAARVAVDEKGCIAAAYTVMAVAGAGMPPEEEMDFVLDRPFIFVITSDSGLPLFAGIVNEP